MCATSMPMQAASAKASACTGDGPACPALSSVMAASPLRPPNTRWRSHTSCTVTGGFIGAIVDGLGRLGSLRLIAREERGNGEPRERQEHEHVGEVMAVDAIGTVRLGRVVEDGAVGQHARFGQLV